MMYTFSDWKDGKEPPEGWRVHDAIEDGWDGEELDELLNAPDEPWSPRPQRAVAYSFMDWLDGKEPPDGWDSSHAVADGWTEAQRDEFLSVTEALQAASERAVEPPAPPAGTSAVRGRPAHIGRVEPPVKPSAPIVARPSPAACSSPASDARMLPATRNAPSPMPSGRVGQIMGVDRFDVELEDWLIGRQWAIKLNRFSGELEIHRPDGVAPMTDERLAEIRFTLIYAKNGQEPAKDKIADAVGLIGERRAYHPVVDYLASLRWDGVHRLDQWLVDYFGAEDTPLNRAFGRKILCAAVRRVMQPGCKFDAMLVLEGAQDLGKSTGISALCPDRAWFTDQLEVGADPKVTIEKTAGAWLVEMPELDGLGRRDTNRVKSFITTTHDRARLAYARFAVTRPRQFVLFGTTNESRYLSDLTGNRRFWIVRVARADPVGIAAIRDQLWAEAVQAEPAENLWLDNPELKVAAAEVARESSDFGPWLELLESRIPEGPLKIPVVELWKLVGIEGAESINKLTKAHHAHMRAAMAGLGFERREAGLRDEAGKKVKAYLRGDPHQAPWWRPGDPPPEEPPDGPRMSDDW